MRTQTAVLVCFTLAHVMAQNTNPNASKIRDFEQSVSNYVKMRKTWTKGTAPLKPGSSPEMVKKHETEVCGKVRAARNGAQQGEFFKPPVKAEFQRLIAMTMAGSDGVKIRETMKESEPVALKLRVNDTYPSSAPLQTTPPTLLLNLPKLPQELEYRFVGRNLILRDVDANLIVDYMTDVIR